MILMKMIMMGGIDPVKYQDHVMFSIVKRLKHLCADLNIVLIQFHIQWMMIMLLMMHLQNRKQIGEVISVSNSIVPVGLLYPRWECVWPAITS